MYWLILGRHPSCRHGDSVITIMADFALVLVYTCALLINVCALSPDICGSFGFGDSSEGVYLFFVFFALAIILMQLVIGLCNLWYAGHVPKLILVARSHTISPWKIFRRLLARR